MAELTNIAWTDSTFNGWIGCTKVGPGCEHCYAEANNVRFHGGSNWGPGAPRRLTTEANWKKPLLWNERAGLMKKRHLVFCSSQADVFDNEVDPRWREALFRLIDKTPYLTWQLLTKRIGNVPEMVLEIGRRELPRNVWLGATVVTHDELTRDLPKLARVPATIRFLSIEPQIERIDLWAVLRAWTERGWKMPIDWVINGGESMQKGRCRPYNIDWARQLASDSAVMGVAFFMKQLGHKAHDPTNPDYKYTGKGEDPHEWPVEIRRREFPR